MHAADLVRHASMVCSVLANRCPSCVFQQAQTPRSLQGRRHMKHGIPILQASRFNKTFKTARRQKLQTPILFRGLFHNPCSYPRRIACSGAKTAVAGAGALSITPSHPMLSPPPPMRLPTLSLRRFPRLPMTAQPRRPAAGRRTWCPEAVLGCARPPSACPNTNGIDS